jgi:hypothetical protein
MTGDDKMKMICEFPVGTLRTLTATNTLVLSAQGLINVPGVGQPFLFFNSLPGKVAAVDFELHEDWAGHGNKVTNDIVKNMAMLQAMLDNPPLDAVVFVS